MPTRDLLLILVSNQYNFKTRNKNGRSTSLDQQGY